MARRIIGEDRASPRASGELGSSSGTIRRLVDRVVVLDTKARALELSKVFEISGAVSVVEYVTTREEALAGEEVMAAFATTLARGPIEPRELRQSLRPGSS